MQGFFSPTALQTRVPTALPQIAQCGACGLYKNCQSPKMKPTGRGKHKILIVGEMPGENEDQQGKQFVGKAGQCLRRMMTAEGIDIDDCWLTNSVICHEGSNTTTDKNIEYCRPNLTNTIKDLKPNVIILLGGSAVKSLIKTEWKDTDNSIGQWAGWQIPSQMYGAWICPTYHPSYVMREQENATLVKIVREHLRNAVSLADSRPQQGTLEAIRRTITVETDPRHSRTLLKSLARRERGICSFDYEASGLKPERPEHFIYCVGWHIPGEETVVCKLDESCHGPLRRFLTNPNMKKVGANIKYEHRWSRVKLGVSVEGWDWDVVVAAHTLDNRTSITGVKFQTYVQFGIGDYNSEIEPYLKAVDDKDNSLNRINEAPVEKVLEYCGVDCVVEWMLAEKQKKQMGVK